MEVQHCFSFWRMKPPRCIFKLPAQRFPDILIQGLLPRFTFFHRSPHALTLTAESRHGDTDMGMDSGAVLTALVLVALIAVHEPAWDPMLAPLASSRPEKIWQILKDIKNPTSLLPRDNYSYLVPSSDLPERARV